MTRTIITLLAMVFTININAQEFEAYKGEVDDSYNFWFYNPQTISDPNAHFPLLIFLHGASLCGRNLNQVKRYGPINAVAKGKIIDCYIVAPQNPGGAWKPEKIWKIVEWAKEKFAVDTTRIYVYGMSLGGYGTIDLAATYPDKIAAAMAMCGGASVRDVSGLSKLPLWIIHGTADRAVSVKASDKVVDAIRATGDDSRLIYSRLPGVDHGRPARLFYMSLTYDWLFSHSTKDPNRECNHSFELTNDMMDNVYNDIREYIPEKEME